MSSSVRIFRHLSFNSGRYLRFSRFNITRNISSSIHDEYIPRPTSQNFQKEFPESLPSENPLRQGENAERYSKVGSLHSSLVTLATRSKCRRASFKYILRTYLSLLEMQTVHKLKSGELRSQGGTRGREL